MKATLWTPVAAFLLCLMSSQPAQAEPPRALSPDAATVVRGNNNFSFELYQQLAKKDGNLFFSPYSISTALAMTHVGARGKTANEMEKTLNFSLDQKRLNPAFAEVQKQLNDPDRKRFYQLSVANALWGQKNYGFHDRFLQLCQKYYGAGLFEVDFGKSERARKRINDWVAEETQNKIKDLIPPGALDSLTKLVLTNAIYFKAAWREKFHKSMTKSELFAISATKKKKVPMMHAYNVCNYVDGGRFQMLELPYKGNSLSMFVVLPRELDGLAAIEKMLTAKKFQSMLKQGKPHIVDTKLPKFKITAKFELKPVLSKMGMPIAFIKGKANFTGMASGENLYISEVVHKAFVDVNEEGTEAAAATGVIAKATSAPVYPRAKFYADKPFVFLLRDNRTGSILFMGRLANPSS